MSHVCGSENGRNCILSCNFLPGGDITVLLEIVCIYLLTCSRYILSVQHNITFSQIFLYVTKLTLSLFEGLLAQIRFKLLLLK